MARKVDWTAERKALFTRLRGRLKFGIGAYHLLLRPEKLPFREFDGLSPEEFREWVDEAIHSLRGKDWHAYMYLFNLTLTAGERNRVVINQGTPMERVVYEPNVWLYVENYEIGAEDAVKLLNDAVGRAVREMIAKEMADAQ